jgi:SAM-dependent methyltransferase
MTPLDILLQKWRMKKAAMHLPKHINYLLDIGCEDGNFFKYYKHTFQYGIGIDPYLVENQKFDNYNLIKGYFPQDFKEEIKFDVIIMTAVFEHFPPQKQIEVINACHHLLQKDGKLILTIPAPRVDFILTILQKIGLVEARSLEEHYGFKVEEVNRLFSINDWQLIYKEIFELGLNYLFVFKKKSSICHY